jgi:hypothetical protein
MCFYLSTLMLPRALHTTQAHTCTHADTCTHSRASQHVRSKNPHCLGRWCLEAHQNKGWRGVRRERNGAPIILAEVDVTITYNPNAGVGARWVTRITTSTFRVVPGPDRTLLSLAEQVRLPIPLRDKATEPRWLAIGLKQACWDEYKAYTTRAVPVVTAVPVVALSRPV